ncbi:PGPGW domain-containing protein [Cellulomonas sp. PhB150]|uniref:PGPGW domain-containing protein n=1 Tax=Cellulomonas sp. PhB150 TaxID=2485188 RepID=UPI000F49FAD2|nr:PGPGW domain-containing protein [Cellulomonas sp. PhB150]ROS23985.1 uncharacterized protein (TIGR02611 family) [Cellulomonas sp. PhB150]
MDSTDEVRAPDATEPAPPAAEPKAPAHDDEIAAAEKHHSAIGRRVDALHARVDAVPGGRLGLRIAVGVVGGLLILAGIAMLVLPGPGWLTIFLGLAVLGTEFAFARRINDWLRERVRRMWAWWKARRAR